MNIANILREEIYTRFPDKINQGWEPRDEPSYIVCCGEAFFNCVQRELREQHSITLGGEIPVDAKFTTWQIPMTGRFEFKVLQNTGYRIFNKADFDQNKYNEQCT